MKNTRMNLFTVEKRDYDVEDGGGRENLKNEVPENSPHDSDNHQLCYQDSCSIFYIFRFMRWGYFVGIIPLKPVMMMGKPKQKDRGQDEIFPVAGGIITFKKNGFQKFVCSIIYILATIWTLVKLSSSYSEAGSLYARPSRILAVVSVIFQMMYVVNFAYTFGLKSKRLTDLFECGAQIQTKPWHSSTTEDGKYKKLVSTVLLPLLLFFLYLFPTLLQLPKYVQKIPGCLETETSYMSLIDCATWKNLRYFLCFWLIFSAELIYNSFLAFVLVLAVTGKEIAAKALQLLEEMDPTDLGSLLLKMEQIRKFFAALNQVGSVPFLCFLCQAIPWTGYRLLDSLPNPKGTTASSTSSSSVGNGGSPPDGAPDGETLVKFYNWCVMAFFAIIIYFAAETKRIIQKFRDNLTLLILKREMEIQPGQGSPQPISIRELPVSFLSSSFAPCKYVKETLKDACIHGGPFFHFSYRFISTIIGIITTLILFELQFGKNEHSRFLTS